MNLSILPEWLMKRPLFDFISDYLYVFFVLLFSVPEFMRREIKQKKKKKYKFCITKINDDYSSINHRTNAGIFEQKHEAT